MKMNLNLLEKLNDKQREAASQIDGSILILAGAGSGKTRTITYRIAHMIENVGISPYSILAVTFTNKAAKEMRERVEELVGDIAKACTISTFHSFGMRLLRMYGKEVGYNSNFTIYDTDDQKRIVKAILKGQNNYYCSNYKNGCKFSLPFLICGKKLTATQLIMLLRQHRTKTISGFKSKTGKPFSAVLRYDTKTAKLHFEFPNAK